METITILLKCLKSKHYIDDVEKAKNEVSVERINLRKPDDLFIQFDLDLRQVKIDGTTTMALGL